MTASGLRRPFPLFPGESPRLLAKQRYVDELSKSELFTRLKDKAEPHHDDVLIREQGNTGRSLSIPRAERYASADWGHILWATPSSTVLRRILHPLLYNVGWALAVAALHRYTGFPAKSSAGIHGLLGSALGLLLVFRTNAAYQRFWEGRTIWEGLLGDARGLARTVMLYREQVGRERLKRVASLVCAFPFVLSEHLGARVLDNYSHLLTREDLLLLNRVSNRPLAIANALGIELRAVPDRAEGNQVRWRAARASPSAFYVLCECVLDSV